MTDKVVKFSAQLDTSAFDRKIQELTNKANELNRNFSKTQSGPTNLSPATQDAYKRATLQNERELVKILGDQEKLADKSAKLIVNKRNEIDNLIKKQRSFVGSIDDEVKLLDKITAKRSNLNALETKHGEMMRVRSGAKGNMSREMYGPPEPTSFGERAMGAMGDFGKGAAAGSGYAAIAAGILKSITATMENMAGAPQRIEYARGSAVSNTVGTDINRAAAGKSPFDALWAPERSKASGMAQAKQTISRLEDSILAIAPGLAITGLFGDRPREKLLSSTLAGFLGANTEKHRLNYEQLVAADQAADMRKNLEAFKEQSPNKRIAAEYLENNMQQNLAGQRMMGISDKGMTGQGGFLQSGAAAGFTGEQMLGMMGGIVGAGGSARRGSTNAILGLQMQRMGLTNSSSILGSLTGGIAGGDKNQNTKSAAIEIMSESFKIGLNNSEFSEENRKFTEAAAAIVARTGDTSANGRKDALDLLGSMVADKTNSGIAAGISNYEEFQKRSSDMSGRRGALKWSMAMKDPILSQLSTTQRASYLSTSLENLPENDPGLQGAAIELSKKSGKTVTAGDIRKALSGVTTGTQLTLPGMQEKMNKYREKMDNFKKENGMSSTDFNERAMAGSLPSEMQSIVGAAEDMERLQFGDMSAKKALGKIHEGELGNYGKEKFNEGGLLDENKTIGDTVTAKAAESADIARKKFDELSDALKTLVGHTKELTDSYNTQSTATQNATNIRLGRMPTGDATNANITSKISPTVQNQGGSSRK